MAMGVVYGGLDYIRWSLIVIFVDVVILTAMLILASLVSPLAAYLFSILVYYMVPISSIFPYAIVALLWVSGFRRLWIFNSRYRMGFLGSLVLIISYFVNVGYMIYALINILIGKVPIPRFLVGNGLILYQSKLLLILSLYLPLPMFISIITGIIGALLSLITLYLLGNDYNERLLRSGSVVSSIGVLFLANIPVVGGPLLMVGLILLIIGLGRVMDKII